MKELKENGNEIKKEKLTLNDLTVVLQFLREQGFDVAIRDNEFELERAKKYLIDIGFSLPLAHDGGDGVRAHYDKRIDKLGVSFTNVLGDRLNPQRKILEDWLNSKYIWR